MSIQILFGLISISVVVLVTERRRAALSCLVFTLAVAWLVGSGLVTAAALDSVQLNERLLEPRWTNRNVIVLLGWELVKWPSGEVTTGLLGAARVEEAARQYLSCRSAGRVCRVLVSGGDPTHQGRPEAEAMAQDLRQLGVAADDLILEPRSNNTFRNAEYSTDLMAGQDFRYVVLVTSGFHLRRSLLYFSHFTRAPLAAAPADHIAPRFSLWPQAINFALLDVAVTEFLGLARYRVYNVLGWNPPPRDRDRAVQ